MFSERGEGVMGVAKAVQEDEDVGGGVGGWCCMRGERLAVGLTGGGLWGGCGIMVRVFVLLVMRHRECGDSAVPGGR